MRQPLRESGLRILMSAPRDDLGIWGVKMYEAALSILTLEVYYRHLPLDRRLRDRSSGVMHDRLDVAPQPTFVTHAAKKCTIAAA